MEKTLQEFLDTTVLKTPQNYVQNLLKTVHSKNITLEDWNTFVKQLDSLVKQSTEIYTGFEIVDTAFKEAVASLLKLPYIGENGNWWVWNGKEYVDSEKPSTGKQGEPGVQGVPGETYTITAKDYTAIAEEVYNILSKYDGGVVDGHYS